VKRGVGRSAPARLIPETLVALPLPGKAAGGRPIAGDRRLAASLSAALTRFVGAIRGDES